MVIRGRECGCFWGVRLRSCDIGCRLWWYILGVGFKRFLRSGLKVESLILILFKGEWWSKWRFLSVFDLGEAFWWSGAFLLKSSRKNLNFWSVSLKWAPEKWKSRVMINKNKNTYTPTPLKKSQRSKRASSGFKVISIKKASPRSKLHHGLKTSKISLFNTAPLYLLQRSILRPFLTVF